MHILLIHQAFAAIDEPGGTRHHELARYLAQRGHRVTVITSRVSYLTGTYTSPSSPKNNHSAVQGGSSDEAFDQRVVIRRSYTYSALHKSFVHRVFSFVSFMLSSFITGLQVRQVDLVWGTSPPIFQGGTAWVLARLKRAPFLFEVRDLWPAFAIGVGVLRKKSLIRLSEWYEGFLYRRADRVLVNSPGFIEHVRSRGAKRIELVPNGADPDMFDLHSDGAFFRNAHALTGKFVALYAGAHGLSNDLGVLLDSADLIRDRKDIVIVLVGDGKDKVALQDRAAQMELENVIFVPPAPKAEMGQVLAAADACVAILKPIPLYATVYPNKVFDYMAAGRPVLLAIDGVIRQVVEENQAGLFIPPGDPAAMAQAICTLADDPEMRRKMGLNGRRTVEGDFNRAKLAEKLLDIMKNMEADQAGFLHSR